MRAAVADDDGPSRVLQVSGDDLRGRGARAVREDDHRLLEGDGVPRGNRQAADAAQVADLHDRSELDEQGRQPHGLGERTAAVAAQVENEALGALRVEVRQVLRHVHRAAAELGIVRTLVHRAVEPRQVDVADLVRDARKRDALDMSRRRLILELDLVAHEVDALLRRAARIGPRHNLEDDLRALLAADLRNRFLHRLPHDVLHHPAVLLHADNLVALLDAPVPFTGAARHNLDNLERALVRREHRADAAESEAHLHVEVLLRRRRHVVGVRIVRAAHGREIVLQDRLLVRLREHRHVLPIVLCNVCDNVERVGGLVQFVVHLPDQHLVLEALAPVLLGIRHGLRPRRVLATDAVGLVRREVPLRLRQEVRRKVDALPQPPHVEVVDVIAEAHVARTDLVVQRLLVRREAVKIGLQEDRMIVVVERHEVRPRPLRDLVVQRLLEDVVLRQRISEPLRDLPVVVPWRHCRRRGKDGRH